MQNWWNYYSGDWSAEPPYSGASPSTTTSHWATLGVNLVYALCN